MKAFTKSNIISVLIIITFFVQVIISKELWIPSEREFPVVSFFSWLPLSLGKTVDIFLLVVMATSIVVLLLKPEQKKSLLLFIIPGLFLVLEDVTRLQPWFYLYLIMLLILSFEAKIGKEKVIQFLQWTLIALYFWGGFNKFTIAFAWEVFPWFTTPMGIGESYHLGFHNLNTFPLPSANYVAYFIPVFEISIPFLLFFKKTRLIGLVFILATHLFSLYAIGPWGHNWNQIVWPWNILMPILSFILFFDKNIIASIQQQKELVKSKVGLVLIAFLFFLPLIGFWGYWDKGLSFHLYSGNANEMEFYFSGYDEGLAKSSMATHLYYDKNTDFSLMKVESWAIEELGAPMYGTPRHMKRIGKHLCNCLDNPDNGGIMILERNGFYSKQDTTLIPCNELK